MTQINIAIDGVAGSGKGTSAKILAKKIGYKYLDTGSMYRAAALYLSEQEVSYDDVSDAKLQLCEINFDTKGDVYVNGKNRENDIRNDTIGTLASTYARHPLVRTHLSNLQKRMVQSRGWIADGRDIGTVVMPDAEVKFFLTADTQVRASRRQKDYEKQGIKKSIEDISEEIEERDSQDMNREVDPLVCLPEAHTIDTSHDSVDEQIEIMYDIVQKILR